MGRGTERTDESAAGAEVQASPPGRPYTPAPLEALGDHNGAVPHCGGIGRVCAV